VNGPSTPLNATTAPFRVLLASRVRLSTVTCFESTTNNQLIAAGAARRPDPGVAHVNVRPSVSTKTSAKVISIIPLTAIVSWGCADPTAETSASSSDTTNVACAGQLAAAAVANTGRTAAGATLGSWQATTTARRSKGVTLSARFMRGLARVRCQWSRSGS